MLGKGRSAPRALKRLLSSHRRSTSPAPSSIFPSSPKFNFPDSIAVSLLSHGLRPPPEKTDIPDHRHDQNGEELNFEHLVARLPPDDHPEHWPRLSFITHLAHNDGMVTANFVARMGRSVHIIDIRTEKEMLGPMGYIPGVNWIPEELLEEFALTQLLLDSMVVIVASDDTQALRALAQLHSFGMVFVGAMMGGMKSWRHGGWMAIRDPAIVSRKGMFRLKSPRGADPVPPTVLPPPLTLADGETKTQEPAACIVTQTLHITPSESVSAPSSPILSTLPCPHVQCKSSPPSPAAASSKLISLDQIKRHIGDPANIQWLKMAAFLFHGRQNCVDGRDEAGVIGTPGGDMGEFIMALAVIEKLTKRTFTFEQVNALFLRRLDAFGRFYMHTDELSVMAMKARMREDPRLAEVLEPIKDNKLAKRAFFFSPPLQYRDAAMEYHLMPEFIGCGHLRFMLIKADQYNVRQELGLHALKAFLLARWDEHPDCDYVILPGVHKEGAVVNVHLKHEIAPFNSIPLINPSCHGRQIFVNHPQVSSYLRQQMAMFLMQQQDLIILSPEGESKFYRWLEEAADMHASLTLEVLASGLPVYHTDFDYNQHASVNKVTNPEKPLVSFRSASSAPATK